MCLESLTGDSTIEDKKIRGKDGKREGNGKESPSTPISGMSAALPQAQDRRGIEDRSRKSEIRRTMLILNFG